jgi:hypothetical protein
MNVEAPVRARKRWPVCVLHKQPHVHLHARTPRLRLSRVRGGTIDYQDVAAERSPQPRFDPLRAAEPQAVRRARLKWRRRYEALGRVFRRPRNVRSRLAARGHELRALRRRARPPSPVAVLADVSGRFQAYLRLLTDTKTPTRFTRDGVHSVGAAYLCEKSTACSRGAADD